MKDINEFRSQDFYLSSCLLAAGITLLRLEKNDSKTVTFVFDDPQHLAPQVISDHWNKKLKIHSRELIEAINELKTRIYSGV